MNAAVVLMGLLIVACSAQQLTSNEFSYPAGTTEAAKAFPGGVYTNIALAGAPSACTGVVGCAPVLQYNFTDGSLVSVGGTINTVPAAAGASCDAGVGCPGVVAVTNPPAKAILLGPGRSLQINVPAGTTGVGFLAGVSTTALITATANNGLTPVNRNLIASGTASTKVFFGVPAPYRVGFTQLTLTSATNTWLVIDDLFYGSIGYYCLGYESVHTCALQINLNDLPQQNVSVQVLGEATDNFGVTNGFPRLVDVGGQLLLICVPETTDPKVDISEGNVKFLSEINGKPDCSTLGPHQCYLDPRAMITVPVDCWPQQDYNLHQPVGGVQYQARIALWKSPASGVSPVIQTNFPFRIIDPTNGGVNLNPPPRPSYCVLAVPGVFSSVSWFRVGAGIDPLNVLDATTSTVYDCSKNNTSPATGVRVKGVCKSLAVGDQTWLGLTRLLNIRAKCSDARIPPMVSNVDLTITAPINPVLPQFPITYVYTGVGNEDTSVCVVAAGLYSVVATEGPVSTFPLTSDCSVGRSTQCNGTPLDVVSIIQTRGCQRVAPCGGVLPPPYPTVGGGSTGLYPISLASFGVTFRTPSVDPNADVSFCVLNLPEVDVAMNVASTGSTANHTIRGRFDCTTGFQSPGICTRLDSALALNLFSVLTVPLSELPAGAINFLVNLVTFDGSNSYVGTLPARPVGLNQGDGFCKRGAQNYQICVPAVGSDRVPWSCGAEYTPAAISVVAEECGPNVNSITCGVVKRDANVRRDPGDCIVATSDVDCRTSATCIARIAQELCVWDLLYLPTYTTGQGVVVDLYAPVSQTAPVRAPYTNQGGMPRSYWVLAGMLKLRITENPDAPLAPIGSGAPLTAPTVFTTDGINCTLANECTYNDFLSVLDASGELTFPATTTIPERSPEVKCSGITYADNFNSRVAKQRLNGATAALSVGSRQFRAPTALNGCDVLPCPPKKIVVIRTKLTNYTVNYAWAGVARSVPDVWCTTKDCAPIPCVVRWAPLDQTCPSLHQHIHIDPHNQLLNDDAAHQDKYMSWRPEPTSSTTLTVGGVKLCSETISSNTQNSTTANSYGCRKSNLFGEVFDRYFVLAPNAGAPNMVVSIKVGCATTNYQLVCANQVEGTGLKVTIRPAAGVVTPCVGPINHYWHRCQWVAATNLIGQAQYWPGVSTTLPATSAPSLIDLPTCNPVAGNVYGWWSPLVPFTLVSVDLRILPDGTEPISAKHASTDSDLTQTGIDQHAYRGDAYTNFGGAPTTRRNPFNLAICCDQCTAKRSLLDQARETSETLRDQTTSKRNHNCAPPPPPISCSNPWLKEEVGGFDNLVCVLAGAQYQYKVQELFRSEDYQEYAPDPLICPVAASGAAWKKRVEGCRPTACISPAPATGPIRYASADHFSYYVNKSETPLLPEYLPEELTYSSNFVCRRGVSPEYWQQHTLLRPNRLLGPAQTNIPYLRDAPYELRSNDRNLVSHSDSFSCAAFGSCRPSPVTIVGKSLKRAQPQ